MATTATTRSKKAAAFPEDYHDYVFRNGVLVGDFDNMYRHAKEVPWHQDKNCRHWYAQAGIQMLKAHAPYESILEIGCGLGYVSAKLRRLTRGRIDAFDVSPAAIRTARRLHAGVRFYVDDIASAEFRPRRQYHLVAIRDVFWYVFPRMETVVRNLESTVRAGGFLYVGQSFPALDSAFVGKEVIPNSEALLAFLSNFEPLHSARLVNHRMVKDGPILHFLGVKTR